MIGVLFLAAYCFFLGWGISLLTRWSKVLSFLLLLATISVLLASSA